MKIGLVGWGIETKSAVRYFGDEHDYLLMSEEPVTDYPKNTTFTVQMNEATRAVGLSGNAVDTSYLEGIDSCELIILTPTAKKTVEKIYEPTHPIWAKITTTLQIFFEVCPSNNIIGITGTKGKGTTTTLIEKILAESGQRTHIGGNIGIPVLDLLPSIQPTDWVVLELSNFQLYKFPYSPHIAVHLMMMPEHLLEWHITMEDYIEAKKNICSHQTPEDIVVYLPTNDYSNKNAAASKGVKIPYTQSPGAHIDNGFITIDGHTIIKTTEVGLRGAHNLENICAAVTATWQIVQNIDAIKHVLATFTGLEHRLQLVDTVAGVRYFDDSFGTTPDTAIVAMNAFSEPKVMIVGGHDKGNDYTPMIQRLTAEDCRFVIGIGPTGTRIAKQLLELGYPKDKLAFKESSNDWTMQEIVASAQAQAKAGDCVLLSTGSASFGIFADYKDRGNQFIAAVKQLA